MKYFFLISFVLGFGNAFTQYPPQVGQKGTSAMYKDSSAFIGWATSCVLELGYQNISNPALGKVSVGKNTMALGKAGSNAVVSLGDGGNATLTFASPIVNGTGYDFAVFENGFSIDATNDFLELAFVEVSSDGVNFVRFPSFSSTQTTSQMGSFGGIDVTKIHNLAGKYLVMYGTPFDLEELKDAPGLNVNNITHVRIIDVVGCIQSAYSSTDSEDKIINDPWPTAFASGGFDLDAVGVINSHVTSISKEELETMISIYPNPVNAGDQFVLSSKIESLLEQPIQLFDSKGKLVYEYSLSSNYYSTEGLASGVYLLKIGMNENQVWKKLIIGM